MIQSILPPELPWSGASQRLIAAPDHPWITPAERSGFEQTPSYEETCAWLERLAAASPLIRLERFGVSPEGRDLIAVFASENGKAPDGTRPVLLVQAGIHSGEIDGKDAGLMLLRDIAFGDRRDLLAGATLVLVPILNVDGHERASPLNRPNQRGPASQGWRNTAQNLNLNRDYAKLDAPEMRALIALVGRVRPDLYLDIHVTDGIDYQYDVTYGFMGRDGSYAASPAIARWLDAQFGSRLDAVLEREGHIPGDLVFAVNDNNPDAGLAAYVFTPRFSQAYGDMIHMASVLVENHSLKPHRQRVLGTYVLIDAAMRLLADDVSSLREATEQDRRARPGRLPVGWRQTAAPVQERAFLPVAFERYRSVASGRDEVRWTGRPEPLRRIAQYGLESTISIERPRAYWVPATKPDVIEVLASHGLLFETLSAPRAAKVEMLRLHGATLAGNISEGRTRVAAGEPMREQRELWMPAGSIRVPTDQSLGELAMILLEPQSEDSLFSWGFFNEILERVEYMEGYIVAPMADEMLARDPALKAEFEAKLASDPAFAADPEARLSWFYMRSPYADARHLLYPVGIER